MIHNIVTLVCEHPKIKELITLVREIHEATVKNGATGRTH